MSNDASRQRIARIILEDAPGIRLSPRIEHERRSALYDLIENNVFRPIGNFTGPYVVEMTVVGERLGFRIMDENGTELRHFNTALGSIRRIVKDYFYVCDNYFSAIKTMSPSRIEAIDMGRRGLHNEGAQLLQERLAIDVEIDLDTARRLFTLVCVLHIRK
jgi:uncharacterized protein (UPF0262 family)